MTARLRRWRAAMLSAIAPRSEPHSERHVTATRATTGAPEPGPEPRMGAEWKQDGVWLIVEQGASLAGAVELAIRLRRLPHRPNVLLSIPPELSASRAAARAEAHEGVMVQPPPAHRRSAVKAVLSWARPRVAMVFGAQIGEAYARALRDCGCAVFLLATERPALARRWRLWPFSEPPLLPLRGAHTRAQSANRVLVTRAEDLGSWVGHMGREAAVEFVGAPAIGAGAMPCNDAERHMLSEQLRLRPVWLAAGVPPSEEAAVIDAHGAALRLSHRLVLLLNPADPGRGPALREALSARFQVALRSLDEPLMPETQVYVVDTEGERGLWYRLATVCLMGGTLSRTGSTIDPMEPAALGAAVVHGGSWGDHAEAYRRLLANRASRAVSEAGALGEAISALMDPARAAAMAKAAWEVTSEAASATDRLLEILRDALRAPSRAADDGRAGGGRTASGADASPSAGAGQGRS